MTTKPVPRPRDMLPDQKRTGRRNTQVCFSRDFSRCCCCCCFSWNACGLPARLVAIRTKPHRFRYCCRQPTITPRPFPATANFSSSRMRAAIMPRDFAPPPPPLVECTRLAAVRLIAKCADMFPFVFDYCHICFLLDLLQLLSRSAQGHAVRLKIPLPLRTARVPTIILPSRGFSCCCTSQRPQGYHPPCVQLRLRHRKVPTMVVQQPSL